MNKHHAAIPLACFACVVALQIGANGSERVPPPSIFFQAKTIAIVDDTGESYIIRRASDELKKWGRYQIVENPDDADLILVLAMREDLVGLEHNTSTDSYTTVYGDGNMATGSDQSNTTGTTRVAAQKSTTVGFFDRRTGRKVWSGTRVWGTTFDSVTPSIIKDLRKRIENAEKDKTKP
jgi:hypothetical protein